MSPRTLLIAIAASATLGGGIGALATVATQSQASPAAIAAAVQRVRDTDAELTLKSILRDLDAIKRIDDAICHSGERVTCPFVP